MTAEVKRLSVEHFDARMELSQFAFQYQLSREELEKRKKQDAELPSAKWGIFDGDKLAAQLTVLDLPVYIGGQSFRMGGVAGVSTWPEYRRQGLVAKLLRHSLQEMKAEGQTISMLHPFSFSFYRKFGWETYIEYKKYTLKTSELPPKTAYEGRMVRVEGQPELLNGIYEQYAVRYNGMLGRSRAWWNIRVFSPKPEVSVVYYNESGEPTGYIIYAVKEKKMTVEEFVALDNQAYSALWTYIGQHDSMIDSVTLTMPSDDMLAYRLPNPRIGQEIVPYFMARIVDAEALVAQYGFVPSADETKSNIRIRDEHAPWNNGDFELTIKSSGEAVLTRYDGELESAGALSIDIGSLTALLLGYRTLGELRAIGRASGMAEEDARRLEARIPKAVTYLADFF